MRNCCRVEDCIAGVRELHRGLINRGNCPVELTLSFHKVIESLEAHHKTEGGKVNQKSIVILKKIEEKKHENKIILPHQEFHLNDDSRCALQRV